MILWLRLPLMCATKPTPQLSCSNSGRYNPWAGGRPVVFGLRMLAVPHAARACTTQRSAPARVGVPAAYCFVLVALAVMVLHSGQLSGSALARSFWVAGSCDADLPSRRP